MSPGQGLVLPSYRYAGHMFTRMMAHSFESRPRHFPIDAILGDAILNHPYAQKVAIRLKSTLAGVQVDLLPGEVFAKERDAGGRVASLLLINIYRDVSRARYIPAAYEDELRFISDRIGKDRELLASTLPIHQGPASRINLQYFDFAEVARFSIEEIGDDFQAAFEAMEEAAGQRGTVIFQAWINMAIPWMGQAVDWLRGRGYFLCGVLPRWFDSDVFIMQRMEHRPNWEGIVMALEQGESLLRLVKRDWERG
jgi:hypothetical protein